MKTNLPIDCRVNLAGDEVTLMLDGVVGNYWGDDGITAKGVAAALSPHAHAKTIVVRLNSPGGSIDDGVAIYNMLKAHPAAVRVEILGAAYSIASVIALAGDEIHMAENAMFMIHDPASIVWGSADEMRKEADVLDKYKKNIVETYSARTGKDEKEIVKAMAEETWYTAKEAKAAGFVTHVMENKTATNRVDLKRFNFKRPPAAITNLQKEEPQMADPVKNEPTPIDPRAEAKRFVDQFGAQGGQWYAEGLSFDQAQAKHNEGITKDAADARAEVERLKAENASLKTRVDAAGGEQTPVSGGETSKAGGRSDKGQPTGLERTLSKVIRIK